MTSILRRRGMRVLVLTVAAALLLPIAAAQARPATTPGGARQQASTTRAAHQHKPKKPKPPKPPKPPNPQPKPPPIGAPSAPVDTSGTMPRAMRDELTGDFRGLGYDQRMRAENASLDIYDSASRGGNPLPNPAPLDLRVAPDNVGTDHPFASVAYERGGSSECFGCMQNWWSYYHLSTIYLARNNQSLFITGTQSNGRDVSTYRNYLYAVSPSGSCASASCAASVTELPSTFMTDANGESQRTVTVTSLAAGYVAGHPYLAVGLSDTGVQIYDVSDPNAPRLTATFGGMATGDDSQTPVTALAWDPAGSGLLAVGVISWADRAFMVHVGADGTVQSWQSSLAGVTRGQLEPLVMSAAIGKGPNGEPVVAFGMDEDGRVQIFDNPTGATQEVAPTSASGGGQGTIVAINPIPRVDGSTGGDDFAVSYQAGSDIGHGSGGLWRWDGTASALTALPLTSGSSPFLPDWDTFRKWYPGIKEGRFRITNASWEPVTIGLHARPQAGYGCWYAPAWADASAFPSQPRTFAAGQTSDIYSMGAYTAGAQGGCGASDPSGTWRGYLTITPVNHPADTKIVNMQLNPDMSVVIGDQPGGDQAGGSTRVVTLTHDHPPNSQQELGGAFGQWTITVNTPAAPTPQAAPTVTGYRLTTTQPGRANVYRFDVGPTTWSVPGAGAATPPATPQVQAVIPPFDVRATVDGTVWTSIGKFQPPSAVSSAPGTVTVGGGSFFWENAPNAPQYQQIRVVDFTVDSTPVFLDLPAPAPEALTQITVSKGLNGNAATPEPNGLDQAALAVQLKNGSEILPGGDPAYGSVYYRDENNNLITNLYQPGNYDSFVGVQPKPGAYPNTGISAQAALPQGSAASYLSTTSTNLHTVQGFVGVSNVKPSQPLNVAANPLNIQIAPSQGGGYSLTGCTDFANSANCQLATAPALYQAGSASTGPLLGVLLAATGQNAAADLPLQWSIKLGAEKLANAALTIQGTNVSIGNPPDFLPNYHLDITLVSHGQLVPGTVQVPGG